MLLFYTYSHTLYNSFGLFHVILRTNPDVYMYRHVNIRFILFILMMHKSVVNKYLSVYLIYLCVTSCLYLSLKSRVDIS